MLLTDDCSREDYVKTLNVNGKEVCLFLDDYGQCYYITYEDGNKVRSLTLSGWNVDYMDDIYSFLDEKYHDISRKMLFGKELSAEEKEELEKYHEIFSKEYGINYGTFLSQ